MMNFVFFCVKKLAKMPNLVTLGMKTWIKLAVITFFLVTLAANVFAENRPFAVTFTVGGGYDFFASKRDIRNVGLPLFELGYDFYPHWGIEGLFGGFSTKFKKTVDDNRQIAGNIGLIDGLYRLAVYNRLQPYLLAGVGVVRLNPNQYDAHNEGNINAGLGLQFFIHPSIALQFETRDLYTIIGGKNDILLNAGVSFLLGGCP